MWLFKLKTSLLELYPELGRLPSFGHLASSLSVKINPRYRRLIRILLPIAILLIILWTGINIGQVISQYITNPPLSLQSPPTITPTPTVTYYSSFEANKEAIENFNPTPPDPIQPVLDYDLTLEPSKK